MPLKLYDYWRSSAAYRVRIALNLKEVSYTSIPVSLKPGDDEQKSMAYTSKNPQMRVPAIEIEGEVIGQSMAIIEWLEETYPLPALLPEDPLSRLKCRAFANVIANDVHPLNNLSVLAVLRNAFGADEQEISDWYSDWIIRGFSALEKIAQQLPRSDFLFGVRPGLAEICLVPQVYNARRFDVDLSAFPRLNEMDARSRELPAFSKAAPENQPGAN